MQTQTLFTHEQLLTVIPSSNPQRANNATLINQTSGDFEYYTPTEIVEAARAVMGSIDLDPASSALANQTVRAGRYFCKEEDGLLQQWFGNLWMNHPFGRDVNAKWINKLRTEYELGAVTQACCITFAATSEQWFQPLYAYPLCFLSPRTNYFNPSGTPKRGVTKGSVVAYMGDNVADFSAKFAQLGQVMLPAWRAGHDDFRHWFYQGGNQ